MTKLDFTSTGLAFGIFIISVIAAFVMMAIASVFLTFALNSEGLGAGSLVSLPDLSFAQAFGSLWALRILRNVSAFRPEVKGK